MGPAASGDESGVRMHGVQVTNCNWNFLTARIVVARRTSIRPAQQLKAREPPQRKQELVEQRPDRLLSGQDGQWIGAV